MMRLDGLCYLLLNFKWLNRNTKTLTGQQRTALWRNLPFDDSLLSTVRIQGLFEFK